VAAKPAPKKKAATGRTASGKQHARTTTTATKATGSSQTAAGAKRQGR
jgi:hypothetical protein